MSTQSGQYVYFYGMDKEHTEGTGSMKSILGGKGSGLAEMALAGLPVPPGFTISTEACAYYYAHDLQFPPELDAEINGKLHQLEQAMGKKLGDPHDPLLVSVRSGAAISMPGMMDTVLNLGLNDQSVLGFINKTCNPRAGWDCYRRFIDMFGDVVMGPSSGLSHKDFELELNACKSKYGVRQDCELSAEALQELCTTYKRVYKEHVGSDFPQDPRTQLSLAIAAVFQSWQSERAVKYRQINKIQGLLGTAVSICSMVFGNMGEDSGTGVAFTRDGSSGAKIPMGEYLTNAQGEDVVAGIRTPKSIEEMPLEALDSWRDAHRQLLEIMQKLESHYHYPQDVEFTVQQGKLWMLQTRNAKRSGLAGLRWAAEMASGFDLWTGEEQPKLMSPEEALMSLSGADLEQLLFPIFKSQDLDLAPYLSSGLPAGPGAASGQIIFDAAEAEAIKTANPQAQLILVRAETSPEDVGGMWAASGVLTSTGGMTSHAAVVARGWGKCCIVGASEIQVHEEQELLICGDTTLIKGDWISLHGSTGKIYLGKLPTHASPVVAALTEGDTQAAKDPIVKLYQLISEWSDQFRQLGVRTNADTPKDARSAKAFGAEGIGLCRTEHMFFSGDRIWDKRAFILAENTEDRQKALERLLPYQRDDFLGLFLAMSGKAVTIRLLDPPLHEFLPHDREGQEEMAKRMQIPVEQVIQRVHQLAEQNPMLGHRGCRLSITYPELCTMQSTAIFEAALSAKAAGHTVYPEIMIPFVGSSAEFCYLEKIIRSCAQEIFTRQNDQVDFKIGTMIEIPRAALLADQIAEAAEFFSFGTNDLTQMTYGISRDDLGSFLGHYLNEKIFPADPFQTLDPYGVASLIRTAVSKGRQARPGLKCGICGEHGGDPDSVKLCAQMGLDYVSCSPFRVPIARLAAAQAAIQNKKST